MAEGGQRSIGGEDNDIPYADADEGSSGEEESHKDRRGIKDEISTSGGEDIPYADADEGISGEEESHKDRRGIKDEISTSGEENISYADADDGSSVEEESDRRKKDEISTSDNKIFFDTERAWKTLKFKVDVNNIKSTKCEYNATDVLDICKLQFVLKSDFEYTDFRRRLREKFEFKVESAGVVHVSGKIVDKNNIDAFWKHLILSVSNALNFKVVESSSFQSKQELESILQVLDDDAKYLIEKGIVGIFLSYETDACIAKFVGSQEDINNVTQGLEHAVAIERKSGNDEKSKLGHHRKISECFQGNIYFEVIDIADDQDTYFEIMGLKELMHERFPDVKYIKEMNDIITYKFSCTDKEELTKAFSWFLGYRKDIKRKDFDFSVEGFKFISQNKNVQAHLKMKLQKLPSALIISDKIYLICHENDLVNSERIVDDSIKTTVIEGTWSPEAELIKKDSPDKIQVFKGNKPGMMIIWYTVDQSVEAKKLIDLVQKYRKYKRKPYSDKQIKAMKVLGVIKELQEEYKDILIRTRDTDVILQGPEMDGLDACFEKLDTVVQQIKFVALNLLSELQQKLLKNGKVQTYVTEKLKGKIALCEDGKTVTGFFIRENENSKSNIYLEIKSCFVEMIIDTRCLEHEKGKSFLLEHPEEVVIGDQGNKTSCIICYTADLSHEIEHLLYSYSKSCTPVVANYLLSFGTKCLEEIKEKHEVGIEIENDRICVKGQYKRGKNVVTEIESHLNTTVLHFGKLDYKRKELLAADKNQIDSVAENCRCCLKAEVFPFESTQTEENGIEYLCTWNLRQSKEQISIAEIDYKTAKLDGLIILVNECLYGEDISGNGEKCYSADQSHRPRLRIGDSKEMVWKKVYVSALVTSESGLTENKQTRQYINAVDLRKFCFDIFAKMFSLGLYKVGFALPTRDPNLIGKLDAVIEAFQDIYTTQVYHNMPDSGLIFGVKTEADRWMQEVDNTLKYTPYAKRNISPRYKGLLNSPCTSVEIAKKSILETGANCIVVAISPDFDLSQGFVSSLVSVACGKMLQAELYSKYKTDLRPWEFVMCQSHNLSQEGIQKLIFGHIPMWKECQKIEDLEVFIEDCLLLADSEGCSTVAFPALGTGKLKYPLRDVAVALFNGVDRYVAEGTIGGISTVYISVPEKDVFLHQILEREQERRKSAETSSGKHHQADGQKYLVAENGSVKYSIITESACERMTSVKIVNVKFEAGNKSLGDSVQKVNFSQLWELNVICGETKEDLMSGVKDVVLLCEDQKITCVNIFCSNGFKNISMADQVDTIIQSVQKQVRLLDPSEYLYLENVRIVVSDAAFSTLYEPKGQDESVSIKGLFSGLIRSVYSKAVSQSPINWKILSHHSPKTRQCLNVTLAGCEHSDLERAKKEITQYIEGIEYFDVDPDMILDEVSAELNLGIVKYLAKLSSKDFQKWKKELSQAFKVYFWISEDTTKIEIRGAFSSILETEQYFETEFPKSPLDTKTGLDFKDQHFDPPKLDNIPASKTCKFISNTFTKASYKFKGVDVTIRCKDITDLHVDCIVCPLHEGVKADRGIAKSVFEKAGETYKGEYAARFGDRPLDSTKCEVTSSGNLSKCKQVMLVRSPEKFDHAKQIHKLLAIKESVENCLTEADRLKFKSIAIPFLGTVGKNQYPTDLCAQEYYRAFCSVNRPKYLEKVFLVDTDKVKVSSVCSMISKCCKVGGIYNNDATTIMTLPNESSVTCYAVESEMHSIKSDVVVMRVDENFHGYRKEIPDLLSCSSEKFKSRYEEQRKLPHGPTTAILIHSGGVGLFKYALFAVTPKFGSVKKDYEKYVRITMKRILDRAENLKASSLALPILCLDDNSDATTASCNAMVESILEYFTDMKETSCMRVIQLLADKRGITNFVDAMICQTEETMV